MCVALGIRSSIDAEPNVYIGQTAFCFSDLADVQVSDVLVTINYVANKIGATIIPKYPGRTKSSPEHSSRLPETCCLSERFSDL
jgi:hypothetical protein